MWQFYYHLSEEDSSYTEVMQELQQSQFCCGLGPPTGCQVMTSSLYKTDVHLIHLFVYEYLYLPRPMTKCFQIDFLFPTGPMRGMNKSNVLQIW